MYLEAKYKNSARISGDVIRRLLFKGDFEVISVGGNRAVVVV